MNPSRLRRVIRSGRWVLLGLYLTVFVALTVAWRDPAWRPYLEPRALAEMGRDLADMPMGVFLVLLGYVLAVVLAVPVGVLVLVGALVFGPWPGIAYTLIGMVSGAVVTYGIGHYTGGALIDSLAPHGRIVKLRQAFRQRGLMAVIAVRVVPVAPFVVVNMVAGAFKVPLRDYVLGSFIGLLPATVLASLFADRLAAALASPDMRTYATLAVLTVLTVVGIWLLKRRFNPR